VNPFNYDGLIDEYLTLGNNKVLLMQDLINDLAAPYPSQLIAETQSMWNENTYLYYWEYVPAKERVIEHMGEKASVSPWSRALHTTDICFALGTVGAEYGEHLLGDSTKLPKDLVARTQAAWYNFAKTGNPNNALIPEWNAFSTDAQKTMVIKPDATWRCESDYRAAAMKILSVIRPHGEK
jgi:carboxylesterase type B